MRSLYDKDCLFPGTVDTETDPVPARRRPPPGPRSRTPSKVRNARLNASWRPETARWTLRGRRTRDRTPRDVRRYGSIVRSGRAGRRERERRA